MIAALLLQVSLAAAAARGASPAPAAAAARSDAPTAVRAARSAGGIAVDGDLSDAAWQQAAPIANFVQREPAEGAAPTERTTVRILFDDDAIYVAAELHDTQPDSVRALLARRDTRSPSDAFYVFLDSYRDRRSGFYFGVNAAGTQYDGTLFNDDWDDDTWDGVWQAAVRRTPEGWAAELRIPYSQLRFRAGAEQEWGINFKRDIARKNEYDYLVYTPQNGSGFVSRFPALVGLTGVHAPRRLEVLPYVTGRAEFLRHDAGDPYNDGSRYRPGVGADVKMGLGPNLTLSGTVNPDFGQVEVDPAVVNLSDVEVFFQERRPFFVEGANLFEFGYGGSNNFWGFNWGGPQFLYTRRIGRAPRGSLPDASFSDVPQGTHILGAAKVSGRVGSWNVGTLSALTQREFARLTALDEAGGPARQWRAEVEPLASYNVIRAQKEVDGGRQGIGVLGTATQRFFGDRRLDAEMNRGAYAVGLDGWTFLDRGRVWVLNGWAGSSLVTGTPERMLALQRNSTHYFQRPDARHVRVDSAATSLFGWGGRLTLNKQKGNTMVNAALGVIDPGLELNDLGFAPRTDMVNAHAVVGYRWTKPTRWYQRASVNTALFSSWDFGGNNTWAGVFHTGNLTLRNFWRPRWRVAVNPRTVNVRATRGGPAILNQPGVELGGGFSSDDRKLLTFGVELSLNRFANGADRSWGVETWAEWKPTQRLQLMFGPSLFRNVDGAQYVGTFADPLATATYGNRYVFGDLRQTTLSANVRLNWIFTPKLSLELFTQPFVSSGEYATLKELRRPRSFDFLRYGTEGSTWDRASGTVDPDGAGPAAPIGVGNPDFTFASLRGNAVLRWEYAPGSTLFLVWTHNRSAANAVGRFAPGRAFDDLFATPADNVLMVKFTYWWNPS